MPPPQDGPVSIHWQWLTGTIETRRRWAAACDEMVRSRAARPPDPPLPVEQGGPAPAADSVAPV